MVKKAILNIDIFITRINLKLQVSNQFSSFETHAKNTYEGHSLLDIYLLKGSFAANNSTNIVTNHSL